MNWIVKITNLEMGTDKKYFSHVTRQIEKSSRSSFFTKDKSLIPRTFHESRSWKEPVDSLEGPGVKYDRR